MGFYSLKMAWDINQIYTAIRFLLRKNQAGSISSTDLFNAWNIEQRVYHSSLIGRFQRNSITKEGINTGLLENQLVLTKLSPFTKPVTLVVTGGLADKPDDFSYLLSLQILGDECEYYEHDQKPFIVKSVIDPPSILEGKYYYTEYEDQYAFLPDTIGQARLDYISNVTDVKWAYTLVLGRQVYDAANSVQPLWDDDSIIEITKATLTNFGVSFKDPDYSNFGRIAQQTGE